MVTLQMCILYSSFYLLILVLTVFTMFLDESFVTSPAPAARARMLILNDGQRNKFKNFVLQKKQEKTTTLTTVKVTFTTLLPRARLSAG